MINKNENNTNSINEEILKNPKVPLHLRIGLAGPRFIDDKQKTLALSQLSRLLALLTDKVISLSYSSIAQQIYRQQKKISATIRLTSSLAIGVDRFVMEKELISTIKSEIQIERAAILPFLTTDLQKGYFDDSLSEDQNHRSHQELLSYLDVIARQDTNRLIELDGNHSSPLSRDEAHYRCAQYLTENIDLLLAVNTASPHLKPADHKAGTDATIELAKRLHRPVIELIMGNNSERFSYRIHHQKRIIARQQSECLEDLVDSIVRHLILFDSLTSPSKKGDSTLGGRSRLGDTILKGLVRHVDDGKHLRICNDKSSEGSLGTISVKYTLKERILGATIFSKFISSMVNPTHYHQVRNSLLQSTVKVEPNAEADNNKNGQGASHARVWSAFFMRSDALADYFASKHRSSYFLIYVLAALALIFAASALTFQDHKLIVFTLIFSEFLTLCLIYMLFYFDHDKHSSWLQNRCMAEAIRPNIYLSRLGKCFSFFTARSSDEFMFREVIGHNHSGAQWICIQQEIINRFIGFEHCSYACSKKEAALKYLNQEWVCGQITYHLTNAARMQSVAKRFSKLTHTLFFLTIIALAIKAVLKFELLGNIESSSIWYGVYQISSLLTAVFPIIGAALFAIRNHAEFDISAQRSLTMLAFFTSFFHSLQGHRNLTNSELEKLIHRLSTVSTQEMSDWLEIYEVKESELG